MSSDTFIKHLTSYSELWNENTLEIIKSLLEADKEGHLCINCKPEWETLIQYQPSPFKILNLHGEKLIYFEKSFHLKNKLEESLNRLIEFKPSSGVNVSKIDDLLTALENKFSQSKDIVFKLNPDQRIAIQNSINSHFQIITGGPGTGKTTVVAFLLQTLLELDLLPNLEEIALVAPTGRAAQRLTESIQSNLNLINENPEFVSSLSGQTLHSLLNYRKNEGTFYYNKDRSLPYRLIIVDEVSMIDLKMMVSLFDALTNIINNQEADFRLILLGDPNQLPSVERGAVLSDFLSEIDPKEKILSELKTSNRQSNQSNLYKLMKTIFPDNKESKNVISFDFPLVSNVQDGFSSKEDVLWIESLDKNPIINFELMITTLWDHLFFPQILEVNQWNLISESQLKSFSKEKFISFINRIRCLSIFRNGFFGIQNIHTKILNHAMKHFQNVKNNFPYVTLSNSIYFGGMPIIILKNDKSRKLFNGDIGLILSIGEELRAVFIIEGILFSFAIDTLPEHEPAFFLTVHKSQGSEYETVLFYLPTLSTINDSVESEGNSLLTKQILYTAVTRAKKRLILIGEKETWEKGINNHPKRKTGFQLKHKTLYG